MALVLATEPIPGRFAPPDKNMDVFLVEGFEERGTKVRVVGRRPSGEALTAKNPPLVLAGDTVVVDSGDIVNGESMGGDGSWLTRRAKSNT